MCHPRSRTAENMTSVYSFFCLVSLFLILTVSAQTCVDKHGNCEFWSENGECQANPDWMLPNCQISCGTCGQNSTTNGLCRDSNNLCEFWSGIGECERNSIWMHRNCRKSCKICQTGDSAVLENRVTETQTRATPRVCHREDTTGRRIVSSNDVLTSNSNFGCVQGLRFASCASNECYNRKFRTMDGTCNNLESPTQAAAFTAYIRLLSPVYADGAQAPTGGFRPSARELSRFLLQDSRVLSFFNFNSLLMPWGQFVTHDIAKTTEGMNTCNSCGNVPGRCFNIPTFPQDFRFGSQRCLAVARSSPLCGSGSANSPREQFNENTAFIDASQVYSSSIRDELTFRSGNSGFMRTSMFGGRIFTPFTNNEAQTGDVRGNNFVGLAALHILFVREHNRIASRLQAINPHWVGDRLYQETRKIIGAQIQAITYQEYLPKILGQFFEQRIGEYAGYQDDVNPAISQTFNTAVFRFGHGMIQDSYALANSFFQRTGNLPLRQATLNSGFLLNQGIDPILLGLMTMPAKLPQRLSNGVTENMFGNLDLGALDIQRGRDHGLPSYNTVREFCNLPRITEFSSFVGIGANLGSMYRNTDNIDLFVGASLEEPEADAVFGPTFACIVGEQFKRLRDGDRFWFENPGIFTPAQVTELRKTSLSRILCNSGDFVQTVPSDAFMITNGAGTQLCSGIPSVDLELWRE